MWGGVIFGMRASPNTSRALIWEQALPALSYLTFLLFYGFILAYTNSLRGVRIIILTGASLLLIAIALLSPTNLIIKDMRIEEYGYAPVTGPLVYPLTIATFSFLIGGAYLLIKKYRESSSYDERNHIFYLLIAIPFPLVGALLDAFTNLPPTSIWCNLLFCAVCSIAILRYHLLDIRVIARKGLTYILSTIAISVPYILILYLIHLFSEEYINKWWVHMSIIVLFAIILRPVYEWAQRVVDRIFYRNRYSHLEALKDFVQSSKSILDLEQISYSLTSLIASALQVSKVCLLLPNESRDKFSIVSCSEQSFPWSDIEIRSSSLFIQWLEREDRALTRRDLDITPEFYGLTPSDKEHIDKLNGELFIPIKSDNNNLLGIITLDKKINNDVFYPEDFQLLFGLAQQMSIVLENARVYRFEKTARKELEEQANRRTEYLHNVAHELRTPLTAMLASTELLQNQSALSKEYHERLVRNLKNSSEALNRRVGELLDLAKDQSGELTIVLRPVDMADLIEKVSSTLEDVFQDMSRSLIVKIETPLPYVNGDRDRIQQVLFNLLSNANKYSGSDSSIILRAYRKDNMLVVSVEDAAPKISDVEKIRIFEPYYRGGDDEQRNRISGLGLGLYIVKRIVELHKGELWIENKAGKGNTFLFNLPIIESNNTA